jgi:hypothetical protein
MSKRKARLNPVQYRTVAQNLVEEATPALESTAAPVKYADVPLYRQISAWTVGYFILLTSLIFLRDASRYMSDHGGLPADAVGGILVRAFVISGLFFPLVPVVYHFYTHHPMQKSHMWFYSLGLLASLPFVGLMIFGLGFWSDDGSALYSLRTLASYLVVFQFPLVIVCLILGWAGLLSRHRSYANFFVALPILNIIFVAVICTGFLFRPY